MLKNYSSLAPKMAYVDRANSTFRSQDVTPENQTPGTNSWDGHSAVPKARLLTPQFGSTSTPKPTQTISTTLPIPKTSGEALPNQTAVASESNGGHSIGFTAADIRDRMNERHNESVKEIDLFTEKDAQWQVLSSSGNDPIQQSVSTEASSLPTQNFGDVPSITIPSADPYASLETTVADPISNAAEAAAAAAEERSVLDRLKGLYDDQEQSARQLWKRNLQRIQSPWNAFRDRDKDVAEQPATPTLETPGLEAPLVDSLDKPGIDHSATVALIETVQQELTNWPRQLNGNVTSPELYRRRQQDLKLLHLIADQPGAAIASIDGMAGSEQEFWQELMLGLAHYRSTKDVTDEQRITVTAGQIRSAVKSLAPMATLGFQRLEICSRINSFGRIQTFPSNDFETGQPLLLYAELENFGTEPTARGTYRTSIDAQLQFLHIDSDEPIETIELSEITDEATSERTDYYQSFELNVPSHLAAGQYRIRLQVRDRIRRKTAEGFVEFQVRLTPERPSEEL